MLMKSYNLPFAEVSIIRPDIVEIVVDEGIEIDDSMVKELHNFFKSQLSKPFSVLVNKTHQYAYTFSAQRKITTLEDMHAVAVVTNTKISRISTETMITGIPKKNKFNIRMFADREVALIWLVAQQDLVKTQPDKSKGNDSDIK